MSYNNTVMLCMRKNDYAALIASLEEKADMTYNDQPLFKNMPLIDRNGSLPPDDLIEFESTVAAVLQDISWHRPETDLVLEIINDADVPYDFIRIGEEIGDCEHIGAYEDKLALVCDWRTICRPYATNPKLPREECIRPWSDNATYGQ